MSQRIPGLPPPPPSPSPGDQPSVRKKARGRSVFFYPQGFYYTCDEFKNNIPELCGDWYVIVLKYLLERGDVDDNTIINLPAVYSGPLGGLRRAKGF